MRQPWACVCHCFLLKGRTAVLQDRQRDAGEHRLAMAGRGATTTCAVHPAAHDIPVPRIQGISYEVEMALRCRTTRHSGFLRGK